MMDALLSRIFQSRRYDIVGNQTASLSYDKRLALASEIEYALQSNTDRGGEEGEDLIAENIDEVIEKTMKNLIKLEEQEKFIGMRVESYRKLLRRRAIILEEASVRATCCGNTSPYGDDEDNYDADRPRHAPLSHAELKIRMNQQEQDEGALSKVVEVQKNILVHMELCRRKVGDLRKKRDDFVEKREECLDFLVVSAAIDMNGVHTADELCLGEDLNDLTNMTNLEVV